MPRELKLFSAVSLTITVYGLLDDDLRYLIMF